VSYLLQYTRRPTRTRRRAHNARVDERLRLNRSDFDGGAEVGVRRGHLGEAVAPPSAVAAAQASDRRLRKPDHLEFAVESAELRDNSPYKIETLIAALTRFRDALVAEAELYAVRERHPT
jgi:hypothetical protein